MGTRPGPYQGGGRSQQGGNQAQAIPQPRPVQYFTKDGNLSASLLEQEAEDTAKSLQRMKASQLRRFYDDVVSLRRRLDLEAGGCL